MRALIRYIRNHIQADFRPGLYGLTALFAALLIGLNYTFRIERGFIDSFRGSWLRPVLYFVLYATAYYGTALLWNRFHPKKRILQQRRFWQHSLFGLSVYAFYAGFYAYNDWSRQLLGGQIYYYAYKCLSNIHSVFTLVLPLYLYYRIRDRDQPDFYGLTPKRDGLWLYATMLLIMIPLVTIASFQADFLSYYPSYKDSGADEVLGVPQWVTAVVYELCYGWDFVPTELLFRGFLVIGLQRIMGTGAVLPMIVTYACIHFGKPMGETISSLFGGYLLGILALYTRSIWGGLLIHLGIAWLMDGAAFLQKAL